MAVGQIPGTQKAFQKDWGGNQPQKGTLGFDSQPHSNPRGLDLWAHEFYSLEPPRMQSRGCPAGALKAYAMIFLGNKNMFCLVFGCVTVGGVFFFCFLISSALREGLLKTRRVLCVFSRCFFQQIQVF